MTLPLVGSVADQLGQLLSRLTALTVRVDVLERSQPKPPATYTTVWSHVQLIGFHHWPEAPDPRAYLRSRHRHTFHVTPRVRVDHENRAVEFHDLRDHVKAWWGITDREWGAASCEKIAADLAAHLTGLGLTVTAITVAEDDEDGATITYPQTT